MKVSSFDAASPFAVGANPGRNVLVVESDPDQRRRVVTQLSHWGYTPHAMASGEEALDALGERRFALALIAIRLPGMSGVDLIRRAPELTESGPVIVVADGTHNAQIVEAIQAGADDVIRRPYTADDLETAIQSVAGRARQERTSPAAEAAGERLQAELALLVSPQMREIQQVIEQAARARSPRAR